MALIDFSGAPHGGRQKLLPEWRSQPPITPTVIIDHSIVGSARGAYWYFRDSTGIESHFIVCGAPSGAADGEIWQLMDTGRRADANHDANAYAISIETEDNGDPDNYPWSDAQLDSLKWLHNTLVRYHPTIKRQKVGDCNGPGLAYHSIWGAPSCYTPSAGKTCPGKPVRVNQWNNILLPAFLSGQGGEGDDLNQEQHNRLKNIHAGLVVPGTTSVAESYELLFGRAKTNYFALETKDPAGAVVAPEQTMEDLYAQVRTVESQVKALCDAAGIPFELVDTSRY
jgi:N-acetylmuramoyl-L-alanine amidase